MLEDFFTLLSGAMAASFARDVAGGLLGPCHLASIPLLGGFILKLSAAPPDGRVLRSIMGDVGMAGNILVSLVFFVIGLGPCTFACLAPVLGVVLTMADTRLVQALLLILAFVAGNCLVAAAGSLAHRVQQYLLWTDRSRTALRLKRATGVLVILGGVYFLSTMF